MNTMTLGMDIGYSNLKLALKRDDHEQSIILPSGAAPADKFGTRFDGSMNSDHIHVLVNEQPYIAGVSPDKAALHTRALHAEYAKSDSYKALFHASLLLAEADEIDVLVTGLPVAQFNDTERKTALEKMMTGNHHVTPARSIVVKKTLVVPQPIGGFLDYVKTNKVDVEDSRILVIDPGFFISRDNAVHDYYFEQAVKSVFNRISVNLPTEPVCSNARGFLIMANAVAQ